MAEKITRCPNCGSVAYYRFGKTVSGKERRLCLIRNLQYIVDRSSAEKPGRPRCPVCNRLMHLYQRQPGFIRYRCSDYPKRKEYVKVASQETVGEDIVK